jgi:lipopolysaccharide/colanic/teichoic acid biosynthesis glycosyltransferase
VKRALDVLLAGLGLLLAAPLLALVAAALLAAQGRPVLFRHLRPGRGGAPFTLLKFRTMRSLRRGELPYFSDEARVTPLGRALRSSSLDELPQLWNVLRGEMSLVGPRPLLLEYLDEYTPAERRRHDVPPGVTGWAQVNGRHLLGFRDRLRLDVWYVDHWSLGLDLRILAATALQVLLRKDVTATQDVDAIGFPLARGAASPAPEAEHRREPPVAAAGGRG